MEGTSERVGLEVHWAGGHRTAVTVIRPVARQEHLSSYPELGQRVAALRNDGQSASNIAQILSDEGWRPAQGGDHFPPSTVERLLTRRAVRHLLTRPPSAVEIPKAPNEWTREEIVDILDMPRVTLYGWINKGVVRARRTPYRNQAVWLIWADAPELNRLRALRAHPRGRRAPGQVKDGLESGANTAQETGRDDDSERGIDKPGPEAYFEEQGR